MGLIETQAMSATPIADATDDACDAALSKLRERIVNRESTLVNEMRYALDDALAHRLYHTVALIEYLAEERGVTL